ncbi:MULTISPECIES: spore germination protein [Paenibacillus]|uniref:spore germination protein n=1 Tax=Paenibacillus TaxID=44249 RepID=UPI00096F5169|nr:MULTISPECIES: spore germination protein [Paenibacillus]OMF39167.1 spore germination protein [Paenibacillus peoriae]QYK62114.1 Spore germination protein B1 [Paenibacillus sp. S25]
MLTRWIRNVLKPGKRYTQDIEKSKQQASSEPINPSLAHTLSLLKLKLGQNSDFIIRDFPENPAPIGHLAVCYIEGLIDQNLLSDVMEGLIAETVSTTSFRFGENSAASLLKRTIPSGNIQMIHSQNEIYLSILSGNAVIAIDGSTYALAVSIAGGVRRAIQEPSTQTVVRGPKEGFTEDVSTNITLIRRKLRTPDLKFESHIIGRYTQTKVILAYIEGVANPEIVREITKRLQSIDTDSILESGYIEEFIQDEPITPFPTMLNSERPDTVAGSLLDGQIAILVDGTPFALIAPVTFFNFFQTAEDYYQRYDISTFLRALRMVSFLVSLLLPSLFIALTTFQQEMIPTTLLITLMAQREGTPFPALLEALMMELMFEVIREAGVRMPRVIGPAVSIVGALVIGQAAVQAGLVSGAMVIVVAFTAISNFVIPYFSMASAVRLLRFALMLLAAALGLFGILIGLIPLIVHLVSLKSFGVHYFMPYSPFYKSNMKDLVIRVPWWAMKTRPSEKSGSNKTRQATHQYPASSDEIKNNDKSDTQK